MVHWVYLFPGQGSQKVGMAQDFMTSHPDLTKKFFDIARQKTGEDLLKLSLEGPEEELNLTYNTQPALLTLSVLIYHLILENNINPPQVMVGHSLGEYSALVCSGSIRFDEAVFLVRKRGEIMQNSVPAGTGTMVAVIGLSLNRLDELLKELSEKGKVEVANYNSSDQIVFALDKSIVPLAIEKAKAWGAKKTVELRVSAPFHSSFMEKAAKEFESVLSEIHISPPRVKYMSNVTADYVSDPEEIRDLLNRQMISPVKWKSIMDRLYTDGFQHFTEIGPGNVLSRLLKREYKKVQAFGLDSVKSLNEWVKEV